METTGSEGEERFIRYMPDGAWLRRDSLCCYMEILLSGKYLKRKRENKRENINVTNIHTPILITPGQVIFNILINE